MADLEQVWGEAVAAAAKALWGVELGDRHRPFVEPPQDSKFGDATSGVPMRLARDLKKAPPVLAGELARKLAGTAHAAKVEPAGGYVNFTAEHAYHGEVIRSIRSAPGDWGRGPSRTARVLVEHTSANPTGPMHIAHARQAAVGDSLANVLEFAGYPVSREFYVNDAGGQIANLGKSILWRYFELFGRELQGDRDNWYKGDYVRELAAELKELHGAKFLDLPEPAAVGACALFGKDRMLDEIRADFGKFRVRMDTWSSEAELRRSGKIESLLESYRSQGLTYTKEGAVWLKTTGFGESEDRVLVKSDGEYTYRMPDIAYHKDKFERGHTWLIDTWGPDHHAEIANRTAALKAIGYNLLPRAEFLKAAAGGTPESKARCFEVLTLQHCRLLKGGQELKMGKRSGSYVTLRELMEEVGVDATRWFLVMRKTDTPMDFDLDVAKKQSLDNPVYYAQYAHARICSIGGQGVAKGLIQPSDITDGVFTGSFDPAHLGPDEVAVLRYARLWPRTVDHAAQALDPALLCMYLTNLSSALQSYYQKPGNRVLAEDDGVRRARLAMCSAVQLTLRSGFRLLGVSAPERLQSAPS